MRRPYRLLASAIALALALALALAVAPSASAQNGSRNAEWWRGISAQEYLVDATQGYLFEVEISELAQDRGRPSWHRGRFTQNGDFNGGQSAAVRRLAQDFEDDYRDLLGASLRIARDLDVDVPRELSPRLQFIVDRLERLRPWDFNRAWLRIQVFTHQELLQLNLRGAIRGEEDEIRTLAQASLPVITDNFGDLLDVIEDFDHRGAPASR